MAKLEKGMVFNAKNVIDYAEGGVVSKELVHSNAGSVTLFSFDAGQGLSEHTAPFDALIQVIDGSMELTVEDVKHIINTGESFVIPSGARHRWIHYEKRPVNLCKIPDYSLSSSLFPTFTPSSDKSAVYCTSTMIDRKLRRGLCSIWHYL